MIPVVCKMDIPNHCFQMVPFLLVTLQHRIVGERLDVWQTNDGLQAFLRENQSRDKTSPT